MPKISFIESNGTQHDVDAATGMSLMEAARDNDVPGIEAECGGACACATCHIYVDMDWLALIGAAEGEEKDLLELADGNGPGSRLSCQVNISEAMDGIIIRLPASQGF